ncbi:hypothetical protein LBMAG53_40050 [Planctomycetota bacterium]|nr:hypothetical protein LBMAG53_40050 [Planctomycetota bacterium]
MSNPSLSRWSAIVTLGLVASLLMLLPGGRSLLDPANYLIWIFMAASFGLYLYGILRSYHQVVLVDQALAEIDRLGELLKDRQAGAAAADRWVIESGRATVNGTVPWAWASFRAGGHERGDRAIGAVESHLHAVGGVVNGVAGAMVSVGLCGTMIGLILSLFTLKSGFNDIEGGAAKLMEHMVEAIGAMGLAFYATLFGAALGGVILRFAHLHVVADIQTVLARWDLATAALDEPAAKDPSPPGKPSGDAHAVAMVEGMLDRLDPAVRTQVQAAIASRAATPVAAPAADIKG